MTNKCCDHCHHHSKYHDNKYDGLSNHHDIIRHDITNIHGNGYDNSKFYDNGQDYLLDNTQHRTVTDSQIAHNIYYNRDLPDWTLRCKSISVSLVEQYSTLSTVVAVVAFRFFFKRSLGGIFSPYFVTDFCRCICCCCCCL